jgi:DNA-binding HxlR family transcriptional regulator
MPTPIFKLRTGRLLPREDSRGYSMMLKDTYVWINGKMTKYNEDLEKEKANNALKDNIRAALRISYSNNQRRLIFVPIRRHIHNIILKVLSEPEFSNAFREIYFVYKVKEPSVNKRAAKESLLNIQNIIDEFAVSSTDYNFLGEEALKKKYKNNYLSIQELMERYCDKWPLSVLFALENDGQIPMSYGAIKKSTNLSADKMLSRALLILEEDGMINKDDSNPARPKYSLTNQGLSLLDILHSFENWIEENNHSIKASRMEFYEKQKIRQKIKQKNQLQKSKKR